MSRHTARLARLEQKAQANTPRRIVVQWPGDPPPENLGPRDVVIVITYGSPAEAEPPPGAGATVILPDNGRDLTKTERIRMTWGDEATP